MWCPEGPRAHEAHPAAGASGHGIDLGGDGALFPRHGWQDAGDGLGQGALSAARSAHHEHIVPSGAGNLNPSFGPLLADYIGKIHVACRTGVLLPQRPPVGLAVPNQKVGDVLVAAQDAEHVVQRSHAKE